MKGTDESFDEISDVVPLANRISIKMGFDLNASQPGPYKIFKTHSHFWQIPEHMKKCRFVIILRNPADALASFYSWEPLFGGYDPNNDTISIGDFYKYRFRGAMERDSFDYFDWVTSWFSNLESIKSVTVFYEDLMASFDDNFDKIRSFLGESVTSEERERIKYLASFEYMRRQPMEGNCWESKWPYADMRATFQF